MDANEDDGHFREDEALFLHPADSGSLRTPGYSAEEKSACPSTPADGGGSDSRTCEEDTSLHRNSSGRRDSSNPFAGLTPGESDPPESCIVFDFPVSNHDKSRDKSQESQLGERQSPLPYPGPGFLSCSISSESMESHFRNDILQTRETSVDPEQPSIIQDRIASQEASSTPGACSSLGSRRTSFPRLFEAPCGESLTARELHSRRPSSSRVAAAAEESALPVYRAETGRDFSQPTPPRASHKQAIVSPDASRGVCARSSRGTTWIPLSKDLDIAGAGKDNMLSPKLERLIWQVRLLRELLAGLIGMQAVFVLTNFVLSNASAAVVALFCMLCCVFAHADRRPATYLLTALLALAVGVAVVVSLCTQVYGFEPYYLDDVLHRLSSGQALVLLLVSLVVAALCVRTVHLQREHLRRAGYTLRTGAQTGVPGPLSNVFLQRGTSTAQYLLRSPESIAVGGSAERSSTVRVPPPLAEEDDELEGSTSTAPPKEVQVS
ncbi:transmembrane protein [Cystoisospora suis]|uniref:Transmembrane protein n=1 Tax=Cystoisospora suis TaxID=483139 RepID=A0A2C6KEN8_9APIC|nr:transmembrane protein [Cystoisospora suis]